MRGRSRTGPGGPAPAGSGRAHSGSAVASVSWTVKTVSAPVMWNTRATAGRIATQVHRAAGGVRPQPGAEQHVEPGRVAELQTGAVDDESRTTRVQCPVQGFAQEFGGVVVEFAHRGEDFALPTVRVSTRSRAGSALPMCSRSMAVPLLALADADDVLEHYKRGAPRCTRGPSHNRTNRINGTCNLQGRAGRARGNTRNGRLGGAANRCEKNPKETHVTPARRHAYPRRAVDNPVRHPHPTTPLPGELADRLLDRPSTGSVRSTRAPCRRTSSPASRSWRGTHDHAYVRNTLVELNLALVRFAAARFGTRSEPMEDIVQVGTIGLIKAIDRFELSRGVEFPTFAMPTIIGEIKRFFRDTSWSVHVPRRLQELRLDLARATDTLSQRLDRSPPSPSSPRNSASRRRRSSRA